MKEFFKKLLNELPYLAGVDMFSIYKADELDKLVELLIAKGRQEPYNKISDAAKQRIILENVTRDEAVTRVPYGCKPGLNVNLVEKWYRRHYEAHENALQGRETEDSKREGYERYVAWAQREGLPVMSYEQATAQVSAEKRNEYAAQFYRMLSQIADHERQRHPVVERFGKSVLPEYYAQQQTDGQH